ncbi:MAG: response regulator, partial [Cyanothece sp. SIO1E1]|nr:response regulator [Cyanothece sp. SIO1E1]
QAYYDTIHAIVKEINLDTVDKPPVVPLKSQPTSVPANTNIVSAKAPQEVKILKAPKTITLGQNGVPLPDTMIIKGIRVPTLQPRLIDIQPFSMKSSATKNIQFLDSEHGLISPEVRGILQDASGAIWLATLGGITRFDGNNFMHFDRLQGLLSFDITSAIQDRRGGFWFGSTNHGLCRYDGVNFIYFEEKDSLLSDWITSIIEDQDGNIWITGNSGLQCLVPDPIRKDSYQLILYPDFPGMQSSMESLIEDKKGNIWISDLAIGALCFDGLSFTLFTEKEGLLSRWTTSIIEDSSDRIWIGTNAGISCYIFPSEDMEFGMFRNYTVKEGLSNNSIRTIIQDQDEILWFGTAFGINRFDGRSFTHITTKDGLSGNSISSMIQDGQGGFWIGTDKQGLNHYLPNSFSHFNLQGIKDITSIIEAEDGGLWISTFGSGLFYFDDYNFKHYSQKQGLPDNLLYTLIQDDSGCLWLGAANEGAISFDGQDFTVYSTDEGLNNNFVFSIFEDDEDVMWFGTRVGVNRMDNRIITQYSFNAAPNSPLNWIINITGDNFGKIWFNPTEDGLIKYDNAQFFHLNSRKQGLQMDEFHVSTLLPDSQDAIWIGSNRGLYSSNGQELKYLELTEGLSSIFFTKMLQDQDKNLWICTNQGIKFLKVNKPSVTQDYDHEIISLGKQDGLKRLMATAACIDHKHRLWLGSKDGLTMLDLNKFTVSKNPPVISLNRLEVSQQKIDFRRLKLDADYQQNLTFGEDLIHCFDTIYPYQNYPGTLVLPHHLNHLTFYFNGLDLLAPHQVRYSYYLEGLEKDWSPLSTESKADYRSIPAGEYTFKVKAKSQGGTWGPTFEYVFKIRAPWYWSWWSKILYLFIFSGGIFGLYRVQLKHQLAIAETKRLKELDEVRTKLYTNISHEFRTPLTIILGIAEQLQNQVISSGLENLRMIRRNGQHLLRLVNQLLALRKLEADSLPVNLVQGDINMYLRYVLQSFQSLSETKNIRLHFLSNQDTLILDYDPIKIQTIFSNLLSNAVKFTPLGGDIYLSTEVLLDNPNTSKLLVKVKDTGVGITDSKLPLIFDRFYQADDEATRKAEGTGIGLTLVKELIHLLGGTIKVKSSLGVGTEFTVALPIQNIAKRSVPISNIPPVDFPTAHQEWKTHEPKELDNQSTILIIEDNLDVLSYLKMCLADEYNLSFAKDGQAGIDLAQKMIPDFVISDIMMPEKDGFEVCKTLKHDERTSHIPIILLTAKADQDSKLLGLRQGADVYLTKPFDKEELHVRISSLLQQRQKLRDHFLTRPPFNVLEAVEQNNHTQQTLDEQFINRIRAIIENHLEDSDFSVRQLCLEANLSQSQLFRKLKALTGKSAIDFIRAIRLAKAKELLKSTNLPISEVAYKIGFADPLYFSRVFNNATGKSPTAYRKQG